MCKVFSNEVILNVEKLNTDIAGLSGESAQAIPKGNLMKLYPLSLKTRILRIKLIQIQEGDVKTKLVEGKKESFKSFTVCK